MFAAAMLGSCTTPPPVGTNEPPDALDRIRAVDLQPRFPQSSATADTGSAGDRSQLYYGSSGGQATGPAAASPGPGAVAGTGDGVDLNFEDSPVSAVAKVILGDILKVGYSIDPRVQALAPMVIDVLNMGPQMKHQVATWGKYSEQIHDYTERGIQKYMPTERGQALEQIVDPYSYRQTLTQPKLIILGTNDRYWPLDARL